MNYQHSSPTVRNVSINGPNCPSSWQTPLELNKSIIQPKLMIWPETYIFSIFLLQISPLLWSSKKYKMFQISFVSFPDWVVKVELNLEPLLCFLPRAFFHNRTLMFFLASCPLSHHIYISMSPLPQVKVPLTTDHKYTESLAVSWTSFVIHKVNGDNKIMNEVTKCIFAFIYMWR